MTIIITNSTTNFVGKQCNNQFIIITKPLLCAQNVYCEYIIILESAVIHTSPLGATATFRGVNP